MYLALGVVYLVILLVIIAVLVPTMVHVVKVNKALPSSKSLFYLVPSFVLAYALYFTAALYKKEDVNIFYCFNLIATTLNFFVFRADIALILPITGEYFIYAVNFVLTAILSSASLVFNVYTFFSLRIRNFFALRRKLKNKCDVVLGTSKSALTYASLNENCVVWDFDLSRPAADLMKNGVTVFRVPLSAKNAAIKLNDSEHNLIAFSDGSFSYPEALALYGSLTDKGCNVRLNIEANQEELKIFKEEFMAKARKGKDADIACFCKYELTARRFVTQHPLTKYIPRSFYNENCTLKSDKQINVVFVGFGKVNFQLFRMCATQFQFAGQEGDRLTAHPVHYYVYDREESSQHNEFFSRVLYEFDKDFADCDFEKPDPICHLTVQKKDVNSIEVKRELSDLVTENSFTYFVVSLEDDLKDASYAQTIKRLFHCENYRIFVRAKNKDDQSLADCGSIIYFGEERELYTHESVVNDDLTSSAQRLNLLYSNVKNPPEWLKQAKALPPEEQNECLLKGLTDPENIKYMKKKWSALPFIEQTSNLHHALHMPFKLHLLGFSMQKRGKEEGISEAAFNLRYQNAGRESGYADYSYFFQTQSANVLAFIEHLRWNALYILSDYKQMKKKDILLVESVNEKGETVRSVPHKNTAKKLHACLTTYRGLHDLILYKYAKLHPNADLSAIDYKADETLHDLGKIYAYDYMDLDKLYTEITAMGYVLKEEESC